MKKFISEKFENLKGKTLSKVENFDNEKLVFTTIEGEVYELSHEQECCESVLIEDICGDLDDLIGEPLLVVEEVKNGQNINLEGAEDFDEWMSFTWTFYKMDTRKGGVTIRFFGESNGYYSETVDFYRIINDN